MNESLLRTIAQLQEFLDATPQVQFSAQGTDQDSQHYKHIINPALNREPGFLGEEIMDISMMIFRTATAPLFVGSVGRK